MNELCNLDIMGEEMFGSEMYTDDFTNNLMFADEFLHENELLKDLKQNKLSNPEEPNAIAGRLGFETDLLEVDYDYNALDPAIEWTPSMDLTDLINQLDNQDVSTLNCDDCQPDGVVFSAEKESILRPMPPDQGFLEVEDTSLLSSTDLVTISDDLVDLNSSFTVPEYKYSNISVPDRSPGHSRSGSTRGARRGRGRVKRLGVSSGRNTEVELDKTSAEYRMRRDRNNVFVRISRERARRRHEETEHRVNELQTENGKLRSRVDRLTSELKILRGLFATVGAAVPPQVDEFLTEELDEDELL